MKKKVIGILVMGLLMVTVAFYAFGVTSENISNTVDESIVWDNGMNYDDIGRCQVDETVNYDIFAADDFYFEEDTEVAVCCAIEGYHQVNYLEANFDWTVEFYLDTGDGETPGDMFAGPFIFSHNEANPIVIEDTGTAIYYKFNFAFPNPITFSGAQKYWLNIYGNGELPTQCGAVYHFSPINLHQTVGKSDYFECPEWKNAEDLSPILEDPIDICFQLLNHYPPSTPDITGPPSGKTGESYDYTFSSTDPEGEDITYCIDWGDGTEEIGPFPSGDDITQSHAWSEEGSYLIRIKARDSQGLESNYGTLSISMPKQKIKFPGLLRFFENQPFQSFFGYLLEEYY